MSSTDLLQSAGEHAAKPASKLATRTNAAPAEVGVAQRGRLAAYLALTKPRIIELLLITTVPPMIVAASGFPSLGLVLITLVGGALSAAGANTLNMVIDRDIDATMSRTAHRPIPSGQVSPRAAFVFGVTLEAAAFALLWFGATPLAAWLAFAAFGFYVCVYSMLLKRNSTQNIVIGGAAGAAPVLVGWAAVTGSLSLVAWLAFAIVFFWTPPHFWALAIRYADDYDSAAVPMLPSVASRRSVLVQMSLHTAAVLALSVWYGLAADSAAIYWLVAIAGGAGFVWQVLALWRNTTPKVAMSLFRYSIVYLGALFLAMGADVLVWGAS